MHLIHLPVVSQQKKKASRPKATEIKVFILPSYQSKIPKKGVRRNLKEAGRCKKIAVHWQMSGLEMKNNFKGI